MANARKKRITHVSKFKKIAVFISRHKMYTFIYVLLLAVMIYAIGNRLYSNYILKMDAANASNMRDGVRDIVDQLRVADTQMKWEDISSCTVYEPRKFGDTVRFSCTSSYEANTTKQDLAEINRTVEYYQSILESSDKIILSNENIPAHTQGRESSMIEVLYPRSFDFKVLGVHTDKCDMNYSIVDQSSDYLLKMHLRCYKNTADAYFEPIRRI